jgi:cytochrome c biogenesis protein
MFLLGMRETPSEPMRYLRIPVDENDGLDGFVRLRMALADPVLREQAVRRYVAAAVDRDRPDLAQALTASGNRALGLFAGVEASASPAAPGMPPILGGLPAVSSFLDENVPEAERERASDVLVRILNGALFELMQLSREREGLKPLPRDENTQAFMTQSVLSLSDSFFYPAPMVFMLKDFEHVQASVFQVARAPGQSIVYLGCLLLIVGIFAMLYVRERRVWVWLTPAAGQPGSHATMALSSNRKTMESDQEFELLKKQLLKVNA